MSRKEEGFTDTVEITQPVNQTSNKDYEAIVQRLAFAAIDEQRRRRRWRIFFILLTFVYLTPLFLSTLGINSIDLLKKEALGKDRKHTALVKMDGVIASNEKASAKNIIASLQDAFDDKQSAAVILQINSPGGSPVQSAEIYDEMRRLRKKHKEIPLYVVVSDMAASGGYFVASAADKIFVNKSSLVGSIGVRMDSFGLVGLIDKLGIERRLLTAGQHKGMLDPFLPENPDEKQQMLTMLEQVHQHFIQAVKTGRGDRLKDDPQLFSGMIWTGEDAIRLGLADDYGSAQSVARDIVKHRKLVDFTQKDLLIDRLAARMGASFGAAVSSRLAGNVNLF